MFPFQPFDAKVRKKGKFILSLFSELKRRNVFRVALAYLMVSWLILQMVDVMTPILMLPDWFARVSFMALVIFFPITLLFTWAFELTPTGIMKTDNVAKEVSTLKSTGQMINYTIITILILIIGFQFWLGENDTADIQQSKTQSIAVLPFVNMSGDINNEYFSDGLSEELLNLMSKFPDLKVVGRTSSFAFKGTNDDLRTIGQALNVSHLLEGSVRKQGNDVRITAQLVRAEDGFQLWSETFDRELSDIFAVQEEIARAISTNLALKMDLANVPNLISTRTDNMESYDLYLESRALLALRGADNTQKALTLINRAVKIDPDFAAQWGLLAQAHTIAYFYAGIESIAEGMFRGEEAARRALRLDPTSSNAHTALGSILRDQHRWSEAQEQFEMALQFDPGNIEAMQQIGQFYIKTAHFSKALPYLLKSRELEPSAHHFLTTEALALYGLGDREQAKEVMTRSLERSMNSVHFPSMSLFFNELDQDIMNDTKKYLELMMEHNKTDNARFFNQRLIDVLADPPKMLDRLEEILDYFKSNPAEINAEGYSPALAFSALAAKNNDFDMALSFLEIENTNSIEFQDPDTLMNLWVMDILNPVLNDPRMKKIRINYGLIDFYKKNGWPDFCQPVGDDDFTCE